MRCVLLANNRLGERVARYLADRGDLVGRVLHDVERRKGFEVPGGFGVPHWTWPDGEAGARDLVPDVVLSVLFGHLLPASWLELASWRALNLHPGLLPFNAGAAPNVWPLVDGTPAGTTLHVMVPALDAGDVVDQVEVPTYPDDTAERLYHRLEDASEALFRRVWPEIGDSEPRPQGPGGSFHRLSELTELDPRPDDLGVIDRLRARTFGPYGAEYEVDGRRYRVRVEIEPLDP